MRRGGPGGGSKRPPVCRGRVPRSRSADLAKSSTTGAGPRQPSGPTRPAPGRPHPEPAERGPGEHSLPAAPSVRALFRTAPPPHPGQHLADHLGADHEVLPGDLLRALGRTGGDGLVQCRVSVAGPLVLGPLALAPGLDGEAQADPGQQVPAEPGDLRIVGGRSPGGTRCRRPAPRAVCSRRSEQPGPPASAPGPRAAGAGRPSRPPCPPPARAGRRVARTRSSGAAVCGGPRRRWTRSSCRGRTLHRCGPGGSRRRPVPGGAPPPRARWGG